MSSQFDAVDEAVQRYGERFGTAPPLMYLADLPEAEAIGRIERAIATGKKIRAEEFESRYPPDSPL